MKILFNNNDLNEALNGVTKLGFVPTMGSLHKGHISLIKKSLKNCEKTIVSIFVNPRQFNNKKDYKNYPKNNHKDLSILKKLKVNFVFMPSKNEIFKFKNKSKIKLMKNDIILCAKFRKGHFEGVLDIMNRFTKIINPQKIFMGEKDFQQLFLVKRFIEKKYNSKIVSCKTIRDVNKLALSSRNIHLNKNDLAIAQKVASNLISFKKRLANKKDLKKLMSLKEKKLENQYKISFQYFELRNKHNLKISKSIKDSKIFIAYYLKNIRLIDNF